MSGSVRPPLIWAVRQIVGTTGDQWNASYEIFDGYGELRPKQITHANAQIDFKYGPRSDNVTVWSNAPYHRRIGVLNRIVVSHVDSGVVHPVREYRLDSNVDAGARLRLENIQECGFVRDASLGATPTCLKPLVIAWTTVAAGTTHYPIVVSSITDGAAVIGVQTQFTWTVASAAANPLNYAEAPFTAGALPGGYTNTQTAIVQQMLTSDGIGGNRSLTFGYKGLALRNNVNRGLIGFQEMRVVDSAYGRFTYTQQRFDWPFLSAVAQQREFSGVYGAGGSMELARTEIGYVSKPQFGGTVQYPYIARTTRWIDEHGMNAGTEKTTTTPCFLPANSDGSCGAGVETEAMTSVVSTTTTGNTPSNPVFNPVTWGDVSDRTITNKLRVVTSAAIYTNTTTPWLLHLPNWSSNRSEAWTSSTDTLTDAKTVYQTYGYKPGTNELTSGVNFTGVTPLQITLARTYVLNGMRDQLNTETLSGAGFTSRTTTYTELTPDGRVVTDSTNPLGQATTGNPATDVDNRFATIAASTDPNGRVSVVDRDPFGKVTHTKDTANNETTITYTRCDVAGALCPTDVGNAAVLKVTTQITNGSTQIAPTRNGYFDVLGRSVMAEVQAFDFASSGKWLRTRTIYDAGGVIQYTTIPYPSNGTATICVGALPGCMWNSSLDPVTGDYMRQDRSDGGFTVSAVPAVVAGSITQSATETILTPGQPNTTITKSATFDLLRRVAKTVDGAGTITLYTYDAHSNLTTVNVDGKLVASMGYDIADNMTSLFDSNFGSTNTTCTTSTTGCYWSYVYDALGEVLMLTDAIGQRADYAYDLLGRPLSRTDRANNIGGSAVQHTWTWDPLNAKGALATRSSPGFNETLSYVAANGLPNAKTTAITVAGIAVLTFTATNNYDGANRVTSVTGAGMNTQPAAGAVTRTFNAQGYPTGFTSGGTALQTTNTTNNFGEVTKETFGNALITTRGYDANSGRLTSIQTGTAALPASLQNLIYTWRTDSALYQRKDANQNGATGAIDTYNYDLLARVTQQSTNVAPNRTLGFGYDRAGNLTSKTNPQAGDLSVTGQAFASTGRPQRLTDVTIGGIANNLQYDANGSISQYAATSGDKLFIAYDGDRRAVRVTKSANANDALPTARDEYWYDGNGDRFLGRETWMQFVGGGLPPTLQTRITYYVRGYQRTVDATGLVTEVTQHSDAMRYVRTSTNSVNRIEYVHRDHLGSVTASTTDSGAVVGPTMSFDPFGGRRSGNWASDATAADMTNILAQENESTRRGFTDHEMLNRTGLIHMNGRVFDPRIGRFLTMDPIISDPANSQSWNRYSYVMNRATSSTDPSGYFGGCGRCGTIYISSPGAAATGMSLPGPGPGSPSGIYDNYVVTGGAGYAAGVGGMNLSFGPTGGGGVGAAAYTNAAAALSSAGVSPVMFSSSRVLEEVTVTAYSPIVFGSGTAVFQAMQTLEYVSPLLAIQISIQYSISKIEAKFTRAGNLPGPPRHTYDLITAPSGRQIAARGGPAAKELGIGSPALSGGSGLFRSLATQVRDFALGGSSDFGSEVLGSKTFGYSTTPFDLLQSAAQYFSSGVNDVGYLYNPIGTNSNSFAFSLLDALGFGGAAPPPGILAPGADIVLPLP